MTIAGPGRRSRPMKRRSRSPGAPVGPRRADVRRAALVAAAGELFVERGVEATTVDEIAARAGVAKGTFYHYFSTKADMLDALRARFSDEMLDRIDRATEACTPGDWTAKLRCWIVATIDAYFDMRALHDVVFHGAEMPLRQAMGDISVVQHLAGVLAAGAEAEGWQVADPRSVAVVMFHGLHGAADETIVGNRPTDEVAPMLADLYVRMIGAAGKTGA